MRTTIEQWRVFAALVEHGTYAAAAEALHKSVSSVHATVQKLQATLGVTLFEVAGRRVALTEGGRRLARHADSLLEQARSLESAAVTLATGEEASIRLGYETIFPRAALHKTLQALVESFPHLRVELHEGVINGVSELFEQRRVDVAITAVVPRVGVCQRLGQIRFAPVAHPEHPLFQLGRKLTVEDLRRQRHILVRDSSADAQGGSAWLQARDVWTVSSMDCSIELISQGFGFAWLPLDRIRHQLDSGALKPLPMQKLNDRHVELYLAHLDTPLSGPVTQCLLKALSAGAGELLE